MNHRGRMKVFNPEAPDDLYGAPDWSIATMDRDRDVNHGFQTIVTLLCVALILGAVIVICTLVIFVARPAGAMDRGQWENSSPQVRDWFRRLLQPDTITRNEVTGELKGTSCCGEGDGYWVHVSVENDRFDGTMIVAYIDDPRPDEPLARIHEDNGTAYVVPTNKIVGEKQRVGNPTGHSLLFLGAKSNFTTGETISQWSDRSTPRPVLCFVDDSSG